MKFGGGVKNFSHSPDYVKFGFREIEFNTSHLSQEQSWDVEEIGLYSDTRSNTMVNCESCSETIEPGTMFYIFCELITCKRCLLEITSVKVVKK